MKTQEFSKPLPSSRREQAMQELAEGRHLLKTLREKVGTHPELEQAIEKIELALNHLTLSTGGML